ncbi:MAG: addiction module toxin RelE [Devosia sp. 66-14]|nr:type II toxin-antitoxin system RelE/ParE family toxin [Devosia sp.]ODS81139.1 MAG: addiction module toxin RelE [Devosia sp. SCN 66-27]OJX25869.1 MAG: addiction module toxin RelE [Devosia sp. 66-14]
MHSVVETPPYLAAAKDAGMSGDVRAEVVNAISRNPEIGDLMEGTGGFRKFRFAKPGMGKRGGFRVVSYYYDEELPVFLITVFGKNEKDNLSKDERNALKAMSRTLADRYRKSKQEKPGK